MWLGLLLANIGKGTNNRDAVGQFLVVLVVVLFEQGLSDPLPGILTYSARHLVLIQNHVWEAKTFHISFFLYSQNLHSICPCVAARDAKLIIQLKTDLLLLI